MHKTTNANIIYIMIYSYQKASDVTDHVVIKLYIYMYAFHYFAIHSIQILCMNTVVL